MNSKQIVRVVVASPGDVQAERDSLDDVIKEVNKTLRLFSWNISVELWRWETDAYPALHLEGAQGVIDSDLKIEDCDVLVAIFWKRIGRPYKDGRVSNTEHEIETAYDAWKRRQRPQILLFFNQEPYTQSIEGWNKRRESLSFDPSGWTVVYPKTTRGHYSFQALLAKDC